MAHALQERYLYNTWQVFLLVICASFQCLGLPLEGEALKRLEKEELQFAEGSLKREMDEARRQGGDAENAIRRAYRKIALRYRKNIFEDSEKFDFQMRVLNLARDALMRGESFLRSDDGEEDEEA